MTTFTESIVEEAALACLEGLGYCILHGPDIAFGEPAAERIDPGFKDAILEGRLRSALAQLNPALPVEALDDAFRKLTRLDAPTLIERNHNLHRLLVDGVTMEHCVDEQRKANSTRIKGMKGMQMLFQLSPASPSSLSQMAFAFKSMSPLNPICRRNRHMLKTCRNIPEKSTRFSPAQTHRSGYPDASGKPDLSYLESLQVAP